MENKSSKDAPKPEKQELAHLPPLHWGAHPSFRSYVPLLCAHLHHLESFRDAEESHNLFGHPLSRVSLCGIITSIAIRRKDAILLLIDDGTGTVQCSVFPRTISGAPRCLPTPRVGDTARVWGTLRLSRLGNLSRCDREVVCTGIHLWRGKDPCPGELIDLAKSSREEQKRVSIGAETEAAVGHVVDGDQAMIHHWTEAMDAFDAQYAHDPKRVVPDLGCAPGGIADWETDKDVEEEDELACEFEKYDVADGVCWKATPSIHEKGEKDTISHSALVFDCLLHCHPEARQEQTQRAQFADLVNVASKSSSAHPVADFEDEEEEEEEEEESFFVEETPDEVVSSEDEKPEKPDQDSETTLLSVFETEHVCKLLPQLSEELVVSALEDLVEQGIVSREIRQKWGYIGRIRVARAILRSVTSMRRVEQKSESSKTSISWNLEHVLQACTTIDSGLNTMPRRTFSDALRWLEGEGLLLVEDDEVRYIGVSTNWKSRLETNQIE